MSLFLTCAIAWLFWGIAKYYSGKIKKIEKSKKFSKLVLLKTAVTSYFKKFLLIAAVIYSILCLLVVLINLLPEYPQSQYLARQLIYALSSIKSFYENFDSGWKPVTLFLLVLFVVVTVYRINATNINGFMDDLVAKYNSGELEELPDTEEMEKLKASILSADAELQKLNRLQPLNDIKSEELERKKETLRMQISMAYKKLLDEDFLRRLELAIDEKNKSNNNQKWWDKAVLFVTSAGMFTSVKRIDAILSTVSTSFLFFAMLTLQSGQIANNTQGAQLRLETVVVELNLQKLDATFAGKLKSKAVPLSDEDKKTIADFSKVLEREIANSYISDSSNINKQQNFYFASTAIRENLLHTYSGHKKNIGDLHDYKATLPFEEVTDNAASNGEATFSKAFHKESDPARAPGEFAKKVEDNLTTVIERLDDKARTSTLTKIKAYMESFKTPVAITDVLDMTFEKLFDHTLADNAKEFFSDLTGDEKITEKIVSQASSKSFNKLFNNSFEYKSKTFMASLIFDKKSVKASIDKIHNFDINIGTTIADQIKVIHNAADLGTKIVNIEAALKKAPPTITYHYINENDAKKMAGQLTDFAGEESTNIFNYKLANTKPGTEEAGFLNANAEDIKKLYKDDIQKNYGNGLSGYEDYFPNRLQGEKSTIYSNAVKPVLGEIPTNALTYSSQEIFNDAFNFSNLLGNNRIGGVLIGRETQNHLNSNLDIRQINWRIINSDIELRITDKDGNVHILGRFNKDIVAQAMAYAADSRPIATTMIIVAQGIPLKVMVHPSLVNTPLGCKIINLDRFVDTYASSNRTGTIAQCLDLFNYSSVLYNAAAFYTIVKRKLYDTVTQNIAEDKLKQYDYSINGNFKEIKAALKNGKVLDDTLYSPMRYKKGYYNQELVRLLIANLNNSQLTDGSKFLEAVEAQLGSEYQAGDLAITDAEIWSGVREQPYSLSPDMRSISYSAEEDPFQTLSFIEQVAFKKSIFKASDSTNDFHPERDSNPWEFLYLKKNNLIQNAIAQNIKLENNQEIMDKSVAFTKLQRLFRNAFQGNLGINFPINRLNDLMGECIANVYYVKTPEWSASYQRYESSMKKNDPSFFKLLKILGVNNKENTDVCR